MAKLSELPYDLHYEIVNHLPLAARILYQTQICSSLRILFQGRLTLSKPESFRLVEWRRASSDVARLLSKDEQQKQIGQVNTIISSSGVPTSHSSKKSIWDTSPSSTPKPAPAAAILLSPQPFTSFTTDELKSVPFADHSDVDLFARCMRLLGKMNGQNPIELQPNTYSPLPPLHLATPLMVVPLRSLSLLSRIGFKVASLIYFLQTIPALHSVETVLMNSAGNAEMILWSFFKPAEHIFRWQSTTSFPSESTEKKRTCTETQAIVIPGPNAQRGQGLQSGFNCLCFHQFNDQNPSISPQDQNPKTFHVIFHDWYDEAEAEGTQDMLQNSQITCNTCKQKIAF